MKRAVFTLIALASFAPCVQAGPVVTAFSPAGWPQSDAALGITGFHIEDFETSSLIPGLQIRLSGGSADYGPTSTVPHVFNPFTDDPNGPTFAAGIWDGSHVLLNRNTAPVPLGYVDSQWANISFLVAGGASSIGFSVQQLEYPTAGLTVVTNLGTSVFALGFIPNFNTNPTLFGGRNGYLRIDAGSGESILSVTVGSVLGDGYSIDHLAFEPSTVPEPSTAVLLFIGLAGIAMGRWKAK